MPPEIMGLIVQKPDLLIIVLIIVLVLGSFAGIAIERYLSKMERRAWRERNRWRWKGKLEGV